MFQVLVSLGILSLSLAEPPSGNPGSSSPNASRSYEHYDVDNKNSYFPEHISEMNRWALEQQVPGEKNSEYASYQPRATTEYPGFLTSALRTRQAPPFANAIYVPPLPDMPLSSENGLQPKSRLAYNGRREEIMYLQHPSSSSKVHGKEEFNTGFRNSHSQPNLNGNSRPSSEQEPTNFGGNQAAYDSQPDTVYEDNRNQNYRPPMNFNELPSSSSVNADYQNHATFSTPGNQEYWPLPSSYESLDLVSSSVPQVKQEQRSYHPSSSSSYAHADHQNHHLPPKPNEYPHTISNTTDLENLSQEVRPIIFSPPARGVEVSQNSGHLLNSNDHPPPNESESQNFQLTANYGLSAHSNGQGIHQNFLPYSNSPTSTNGQQHKSTTNSYDDVITFSKEKEHYRPPTNFYEQPNNVQNGNHKYRHPLTSYGPPAHDNDEQYYNKPANNSYDAVMTQHSWTSPQSSTEFHYYSEHETSLKPLDTFTQAPPLLKHEDSPPKNYHLPQVGNFNGLTSSSHPLATGIHIQNSYSAGNYEFKYEVGNKKVRNQYGQTNLRDSKSFPVQDDVRPSDFLTQADVHKSDNYEGTSIPNINYEEDMHNLQKGFHSETSSYIKEPNDYPMESPRPTLLLPNSGPAQPAGYHYQN